jgi:hypothetical protein
MSDYWVVGAMWGGHDDQSESSFVVDTGFSVGLTRSSRHRLNFVTESSPMTVSRSSACSVKDRRNRDPRAWRREIDADDKRVYVDWLVKGLTRRVPSRGCYRSIHGPFDANDDWVKVAFCV